MDEWAKFGIIEGVRHRKECGKVERTGLENREIAGMSQLSRRKSQSRKKKPSPRPPLFAQRSISFSGLRGFVDASSAK
jgi:hypothetical protein